MSDEEDIHGDDTSSSTRAIGASGAIVTLEPDDFARLLKMAEKSLVVTAISGWKKHNYHYLSSYKGLIFYTKSKVKLSFPSSTELITSKHIWVPS